MPNTQNSDTERECLHRALVAIVVERGHDGATLDLLLERAGLDQAAFARHYPSLDACFTEVWEGLTQQFLECTGGAYAAAGDWREGLRAAAWAYCRFLSDDRDRARFLIDVTFANEMVHASRDFVMDAYTELIHLGRQEREQAAEVPRAVAEGIVGAIWEWVATSVKEDAFDVMPTQVPKMMYLTVLPYLGPEAAREELRRGPADLARYERGEL